MRLLCAALPGSLRVYTPSVDGHGTLTGLSAVQDVPVGRNPRHIAFTTVAGGVEVLLVTVVGGLEILDVSAAGWLTPRSKIDFGDGDASLADMDMDCVAVIGGGAGGL